MAERAITPGLGEELIAAVHKAEAYYTVLGHGSFAAGNAEGGLTTIEEKSLGAYAKSGHAPDQRGHQAGRHPRPSRAATCST